MIDINTSYWIHVDRNYPFSKDDGDLVTPLVSSYISSFNESEDCVHFENSMPLPLFEVTCVYTVTKLIP